MPLPLILPFADPRAADVAAAGGKGANLAALTQAGFPVPPGFVVTPDAYRTFAVPLADLVAACAGLAAEDHGAIAAASARLLAAAAELPPPDGLAAAITRRCASGRWAVRSSGTLEDMAGAAFAGQHDTFLNCAGPRDVLEKLRACWLSLWSPRAVAYRARMGFDHGAVTMAVVVQQMAWCDVAGVAFSVNPVSGELGQAVINANFGLGESVVSGEGEVDHLVVDRASGRVLEARIAAKTRRVVAETGGDRGGTREENVAGDAATRPALDDTQVRALVNLVAQVEAHYGWPQDIEWGVAGGTLVLLQSRPITAIAPRWTRDESAERFPNAVTPLTWDLVDAGFHQSLNHSFRLMGLPPYEGKWFALFDHYVYGNQSAVELYARRAPVTIGSVAELQAKLPALLARFAWVRDLPSAWHGDLPAYLAELGRLAAEPVEQYDPRALWDHLERVNRLGTRYFLPNIAISIGHGLLHRSLQTLLGLLAGDEEARRWTAELVACETMTTRVNAGLRELAQRVRTEPATRAALGAEDAATLLASPRARGTPFWDAFWAFVADHGHRETDFDAYHPTWGEATWVVLEHVRALADVPTAPSRSAPPTPELEAGIVSRLPPPLRDFGAALIRLAREYTALDDLEHYHTTRLSPLIRRVVRELGRRLAARDLVADPLDPFFARRDALAHAVAANAPGEWRALSDAIARAKASYLAAARTAPPWVPGETTVAPADATSYVGIPGSPGVAEGEVFVVRGVEDFAAFPKGAVLVARTTNPAWTPLFYAAAAVVAESGGPLSHGAVTAREMRIPAVMAVRGATQTLRNGERVRVDGAAGRVTRL